MTIGLIIRGARLGYGPKPFGYMRISDHPRGFLIEIIPIGTNPKDRNERS